MRCPVQHKMMIIDPEDNVGVALRDLAAGEGILCEGVGDLTVKEAIPASHKIALRDIDAGEEIVKYGEVVAVSARKIERGAWIHTHNVESGRWKK